MKTLIKSFVSDDFGSKYNPIFHILGMINIFIKIKNGHFYPLFKAFHQVKMQKNGSFSRFGQIKNVH